MRHLQKRITLLVITILCSLSIFAQDTKKIEVDINTKGSGEAASNFFMQPWVWVVGGAIFILILVGLLKNNRSRD